MIAHPCQYINDIFWKGTDAIMKSFSECPRLDVFKSDLVKGAQFSSIYEFPLLKGTDFKPTEAIPFHIAAKAKDYNQWLHFYIHDYQFERVWKDPNRYFPLFKKFQGVITPDYSLYREMPLVMQMWNTYRNRAIAYWLQSNGINIVPNVSWGDERTYSFAFEGLMTGGSVAVSTNGCIQSKMERYYFANGLAKMVMALKPQTIINYSQTPDDIFGEYIKQGICVIQIKNQALAARKTVA